MFHQGTLQDGISKALQESKSVLCFVTDAGEESNKWENEWLQDQNIPNAVEQRAVAIRIEAESEESKFLAAVCPVSSIPTIAVIHQGQLLDQLNSGVSKNDFTLRILQAIRPGQSSTSSTSSSSNTPNNARTNSTLSTSSSVPSNQPSATPERPQPLKSPQTPPNQPSNEDKKQQRETYEQEQARRKKEAKTERARILKEIENDKLERRRREEERKRAAQANAEELSVPVDTNSTSQTVPSQARPSAKSNYMSANIQARLPDGSSVRKSFPAESNIKTVRAWINEQAGISSPYSLKLVLTPAPSRTISEEKDKDTSTLVELGLAPSATLVVVPGKSKLSSYKFSPAADGLGTGTGASGILANLVNFIVTWVSWLLEIVIRWSGPALDKIKFFLGLNNAVAPGQSPRTDDTSSQRAQPPPSSQSQEKAKSSGVSSAASRSGSGGIRIRSLRDQRDETDEDKNQFYNGNRLSFESNTNEKDDQDSGNNP